MLFPADLHDRIRNGQVTVAFRRWQRPTVSAGGTLRTPAGLLAIDDLAPITGVDITDGDARAAGFDSVDELVDTLWSDDDGDRTLYRIRFHRAGDDPRVALREDVELTPEEVADIDAQLDRWDAASRAEPWTAQLLQLLRQRAGEPSRVLAPEVGLDQPRFKRRVRQLKDLGLTESLDVGYRLSPRGVAYLDRCERPVG
ncbi:MAG: hypothetical protein JJU45_19710 [Acidimicrobiia bacterium]|nr:hypothetical protein [Acidimicrobiia bacterium]